MKKIVNTILLAATFITGTVFAKIESDDSLLWEISGNNLETPSYLYGTMHLVCNTDMVKKEKVQKAIDQTRQLYLELDMDDPKMPLIIMELSNKFPKIKDLEDKTKKDKLLKLAAQKFEMKESIIEQTNLMTMFSMLMMKSVTECAFPTSVEQSLIQEFSKDKKQVEGLETPEIQMNFLYNSGVVDLDSILLTLVEFEEMEEMYSNMSKLYSSEDLSELHLHITTPNELYPAAMQEKMQTEIINKRNFNWAKDIPKIAKQKPTFFGVGAGHLDGENGVIQLLKDQGFNVKPVHE